MLHMAVDSRWPECAEYFLKIGADPHGVDNKDQTAREHAESLMRTSPDPSDRKILGRMISDLSLAETTYKDYIPPASWSSITLSEYPEPPPAALPEKTVGIAALLRRASVRLSGSVPRRS